LIYAVERNLLKEKIQLIFDYPANIASMLLDDEIDIGLIPVAVIPDMKEHAIISDYCIGCEGEVASVCLFSEVPVEDIKEVLLDYQSRTSVELLKILLRDYWRHSPVFLSTSEGYVDRIKGTTAGLVIGDRAFSLLYRYPYVYDLGAIWKQHTGLPFVFAAWVSNKKLDEGFLCAFNQANAYGLDHIDLVMRQLHLPGYDLRRYFTRNIDYRLDDRKRAGLDLFLRLIQKEGDAAADAGAATAAAAAAADRAAAKMRYK
jgi:chorismate dehydratase